MQGYDMVNHNANAYFQQLNAGKTASEIRAKWNTDQKKAKKTLWIFLAIFFLMFGLCVFLSATDVMESAIKFEEGDKYADTL